MLMAHSAPSLNIYNGSASAALVLRIWVRAGRMGDASSFGTMMCRSNSGRHRHQQHICCIYAIYYTIYTMERCVPSTSYVGVVDHLDESWKDGGRVLFCNDDMQFKPSYIKAQYRILTSQSTINRYWQVLLIFDCSSQRTCFGKFWCLYLSAVFHVLESKVMNMKGTQQGNSL